MAEPLKKTTGVALFWSLLDKGGQQVIQLIFSCILARLLSREDFGLIAVLAIFTAIASLLQESGFSSALIRKKNIDQKDYSSVFYFNICISILIYFTLFFCAPFIAQFYKSDVLTNLSRLIFLSFVFNAFGIIQNVNIVRRLDFKKNTAISLTAGSIAGILSIYLAFNGYGVWSLAVQIVVQSLIRNVLLWIFVKWRPSLFFSLSRIKVMIPYSSKLLFSGLLNHITSNLYSNTIGKVFSFTQAGEYSQAYKLNIIPQAVISDGIKSVAYPMLTKIDNDADRSRRAFRKIVRITAFISFPIAAILIVLANPIVLILWSDKWINVVPLLQIMAIGGAFYPIYTLISAPLQTLGKSGTLFKIEAFRNILTILSLFICIPFGIIGMVIGLSTVNTLFFFVGMSITGRYIVYPIKDVCKDIAPYLLISIFSFVIAASLKLFIRDNMILLAALQFLVGSGLYIIISKVGGSAVINDIINLIRNRK